MAFASAGTNLIYEYEAEQTIPAQEPKPVQHGEGANLYSLPGGGQPWVFYSWAERGQGEGLWRDPEAGGVAVGVRPALDGVLSDPLFGVEAKLNQKIELPEKGAYVLTIKYTTEGAGVPRFQILTPDGASEIGDTELKVLSSDNEGKKHILVGDKSPGEWKVAKVPFTYEGGPGKLDFLLSANEGDSDSAVFIQSVKLESTD